jgi:hypothetical protein
VVIGKIALELPMHVGLGEQEVILEMGSSEVVCCRVGSVHAIR